MAYSEDFDKKKVCVIVPTYNNAKTLKQVLDSILEYTAHVIVVNDGSTDSTSEVLKPYDSQIHLISYEKNKGKGYALRKGFRYAFTKGFHYGITIDSDGQHFASDLLSFLEALEPNTLIVGARSFDAENMPGKNKFANCFSNFWFWAETGQRLPDTQSGYRMYPLQKLSGMKFFSEKYEFEIEVIVRAAWKGIQIKSIPIKVHYPKENERVSHFRPRVDFIRISILNTILVLWAFLVVRPIQFVRKLTWSNIKEFFEKNLIKTKESSLKLALAVALGVFCGIIPIWGFQLATALALAHIFRLNKLITAVAANISIPPMIPFIIFGSYKTGGWVMGKEAKLDFSRAVNIKTVANDMLVYIVGSFPFAILTAVFISFIVFVILVSSRKK